MPITLTAGDDAITVKIGAAPPGAAIRGTLWLVMYDRSVSVPIAARRELRPARITYNNVVRKLRPIAMWKGEPMSVDLPRSEMNAGQGRRAAPCSCRRRRPSGLPGPILGAATHQATRTPADA